jgi:hypothetical protein
MNEMKKWSKEISEIPIHYIADDSGYEQQLYLYFVYWLLSRASQHNFRKVDDTLTLKCWCWWLVTSCKLDGKMGDFHIPGNDNSLPRWVIGFWPSSKVRVKLSQSVPKRHISAGDVWRHSFFKFSSGWKWAVNLTFRPTCPQEKVLPATIEQDKTFWRRE